jgi:MFS family permease
MEHDLSDIEQRIGQNSMVGGILQASLALLMIGGVFAGRWLINTLKTRLTYPRTGYVEYQVNERGRRWKRILPLILGFVIAALITVFVRRFQFFDSVVAVTGLIVAVILVVVQAKSSGLARFYVLGAVSLVLGFVLSLSGLPEGYSLGLFYGLMGVCSFISGGFTLRRYLQENPLPAETGNG